MYYVKFLFLSVFFLFLTACFKPNISDFKKVEPKFDMYKVFNGKFKGTGIVFDRNGLIIDSFVIDLDVLWEDPNSFIIKEKTIFSNKEVKERSWIYKLKNNNEIEAGTDDKIGLNLGNDIVDVARGSIAGNARYLNYVFRAKIVDKNSVVKDKKTKDSNEVANLNNSVGNDSSKQEIKTIDLDVRDFLYMIDENNLINRLYYFKFGIYAGEAVIFYSKVK